MKLIITENQSLFLRRRVNEIDHYIKDALKNVDPSEYNYQDYVEEIAWQVVDKYENKLNSDDMESLMDYIRDNYWKIIETHYLKYQKGFD